MNGKSRLLEIENTVQRKKSADTMSKEYREAFVDVWEILKNTEEELVNRIPQKALRFFYENGDLDYKTSYKVGKGLKEQELSEKTKDILAVIFRDFYCNDEERREYDEHLKHNERNYLQKLQNYLFKEITIFQAENSIGKMHPDKLKEYPIGCAETLVILDKIMKNYADRVSDTYKKILGLFAKKEYKFSFTWQVGQKISLHRETLEILSDIHERYWQGFTVPFKDIAVEMEIIDWKSVFGDDFYDS
ncbi:MAG: hypothetical protein J6A75_02625 [Lachnospiraceae bacterium]|nr:hypothetical protein [Lachnospiraceae bacterium]